MRPEWANDEITQVMIKMLECLEKDPEELMGVHTANNWNDCAAIKEDMKVL